MDNYKPLLFLLGCYLAGVVYLTVKQDPLVPQKYLSHPVATPVRAGDTVDAVDNTTDPNVQSNALTDSQTRSTENKAHVSGSPSESEKSDDSAQSESIQQTEAEKSPRDYLVRFNSIDEMTAFMDKAKRLGLDILDYSDKLKVVRVGADTAEKFAQLFGNDFPDSNVEENNELMTPDHPDLSITPSSGNFEEFGAASLPFLGLDARRENWGQGVTIAILDTKVEEHPSLDKSKIYSVNLLGKTDDDSGDFKGHGTAVASIINGVDGTAPGIAPAADIIALQVLDSHGVGDSFTVAKGIMDAVDYGAQILNMSLGSYGDNHVLRAAVDYALSRGAVIVAATGNEGASRIMFPARYSDDNIIGVGGVDRNEQLLSFSNTGDGVDITAPGYGIHTAWSDNQMVSFSGTSAAAPFISAIIAGTLSDNPGMSPAEAARTILQYANDKGAPGEDLEYGRGIVNYKRIELRNEPGLYDLAVADFYMPEQIIPSGSNEFPIIVTIQNRGTEHIDEAEVMVSINGQVQYYPIYDLEPGESIGQYALLEATSLEEGEVIEVYSEVETKGRFEQNTQNNQRVSDFSVIPQCPALGNF